jgi:hypothetical protein
VGKSIAIAMTLIKAVNLIIPMDTKTVPAKFLKQRPFAIAGWLLKHFQTVEPPATDGTLRFITIGLSHYCEKARWALDQSGILYKEDAHPPGKRCDP